jgi:hypothetical protein
MHREKLMPLVCMRMAAKDNAFADVSLKEARDWYKEASGEEASFSSKSAQMKRASIRLFLLHKINFSIPDQRDDSQLACCYCQSGKENCRRSFQKAAPEG